jgi:Skp family chaperone for outer membrane proteins
MRLAFPFLGIVLLVATAGAARAEAPIATVDMVDLLKAHPSLKKLDAAVDARQKEAEEFAKAEQEKLKDLQGKIDLESQTSPNRVALEKEYARLAAGLNFEMEWRKRDISREYVRGMEQLYASIEALVSRYAREQKISVVVNRVKEDLRASSVDDFGLKVRLRSVVFADSTIDITEAVKRLLPR